MKILPLECLLNTLNTLDDLCNFPPPKSWNRLKNSTLKISCHMVAKCLILIIMNYVNYFKTYSDKHSCIVVTEFEKSRLPRTQ